MIDKEVLAQRLAQQTWANNLWRRKLHFGGEFPQLQCWILLTTDPWPAKETAESCTAEPWVKTARSLRMAPSNGWRGDARLRMCAYAWSSQPVYNLQLHSEMQMSAKSNIHGDAAVFWRLIIYVHLDQETSLEILLLLLFWSQDLPMKRCYVQPLDLDGWSVTTCQICGWLCWSSGPIGPVVKSRSTSCSGFISCISLVIWWIDSSPLTTLERWLDPCRIPPKPMQTINFASRSNFFMVTSQCQMSRGT